jgi:hypothetical protein
MPWNKGLYTSSERMVMFFSLANSTISCNSDFLRTAPLGLFGLLQRLVTNQNIGVGSQAHFRIISFVLDLTMPFSSSKSGAHCFSAVAFHSSTSAPKDAG